MSSKPEPSPIASPITFWEERHAARDPWTSGGDRGLSIGENREFYAIRLAMICRALRQHLSAERGLRILDAGCGKGHLVNDLRAFGHQASGFDSSPSAIAEATKEYGEHFALSHLHHYQPTLVFDAVMSIDVLFHVLDDALWELGLSALTAYASSESLLIISDVFGDETFPLGNYIVHRARARYETVLKSKGFQLLEIIPYNFGANPNSLGVFRRSPA